MASSSSTTPIDMIDCAQYKIRQTCAAQPNCQWRKYPGKRSWYCARRSGVLQGQRYDQQQQSQPQTDTDMAEAAVGVVGLVRLPHAGCAMHQNKLDCYRNDRNCRWDDAANRCIQRPGVDTGVYYYQDPVDGKLKNTRDFPQDIPFPPRPPGPEDLAAFMNRDYSAYWIKPEMDTDMAEAVGPPLPQGTSSSSSSMSTIPTELAIRPHAPIHPVFSATPLVDVLLPSRRSGQLPVGHTSNSRAVGWFDPYVTGRRVALPRAVRDPVPVVIPQQAWDTIPNAPIAMNWETGQPIYATPPVSVSPPPSQLVQPMNVDSHAYPSSVQRRTPQRTRHTTTSVQPYRPPSVSRTANNMHLDFDHVVVPSHPPPPQIFPTPSMTPPPPSAPPPAAPLNNPGLLQVSIPPSIPSNPLSQAIQALNDSPSNMISPVIPMHPPGPSSATQTTTIPARSPVNQGSSSSPSYFTPPTSPTHQPSVIPLMTPGTPTAPPRRPSVVPPARTQTPSSVSPSITLWPTMDSHDAATSPQGPFASPQTRAPSPSPLRQQATESSSNWWSNLFGARSPQTTSPPRGPPLGNLQRPQRRPTDGNRILNVTPQHPVQWIDPSGAPGPSGLPRTPHGPSGPSGPSNAATPHAIAPPIALAPHVQSYTPPPAWSSASPLHMTTTGWYNTDDECDCIPTRKRSGRRSKKSRSRSKPRARQASPSRSKQRSTRSRKRKTLPLKRKKSSIKGRKLTCVKVKIRDSRRLKKH